MSWRARRKRRHDGTGGRTSGRIGWSVIHRGMSIVRRAPNGFLWAKGLIPIATPSSTLETGDRRGKTKGIMISHASDFQLSLWFPLLWLRLPPFCDCRGKRRSTEANFYHPLFRTDSKLYRSMRRHSVYLVELRPFLRKVLFLR